MTVRELLARMGSAELAEWRAYEQITGPLGGARGDVQAALVASVIASANRGKNQRAPKLSDFMPRWDQGVRTKKTPEELFRLAVQANVSLGGRINTTDS